jgi:hypothetical protein
MMQAESGVFGVFIGLPTSEIESHGSFMINSGYVLLQVGADRGCLDLGDRATPTSGAFGKMRETG